LKNYFPHKGTKGLWLKVTSIFYQLIKGLQIGNFLHFAGRRIRGVLPALDDRMHRWTLGGGKKGRSADPFFAMSREKEKKRSSQASWKTCCLGTPFPRSALFL